MHHTTFPYVFLDAAICMSLHRPGHSKAVVVATGVTADGGRAPCVTILLLSNSLCRTGVCFCSKVSGPGRVSYPLESDILINVSINLTGEPAGQENPRYGASFIARRSPAQCMSEPAQNVAQGALAGSRDGRFDQPE